MNRSSRWQKLLANIFNLETPDVESCHPANAGDITLKNSLSTTPLQPNMSETFDFDLFVLGCGSAGVRAARMSAKYGAKVCVADDMAVGLGGTCVNVGCVPKKLFVYGSLHGHHWEHARGFGFQVGEVPSVEWPNLIVNKDAEISRLNGIYERMLVGAGCTLVKQRGEIFDAHTVLLGDGTTRTAGKILICVGGWPTVPDVPLGGKEYIISSNECFYLEKAPKNVVIWGGGYIAVEMAGIFKGYGADVHIIIRQDLVLRGFDEDVRIHLQNELKKNGFFIHETTTVKKVEKVGDDEFKVFLDDESTLACDLVLAATGRKPKLNIGLEKVGIMVDERTNEIIVDEDGKTSCPSIFAVGDCTNAMKLTPVALEQGHCFADTFFGNNPRLPDLESVATAVFSYPNVGTVGLTENEAVAKYGRVRVFNSIYTPLKCHIGQANLTIQEREKDFMKIIVDTATDKVVGIHMVGDNAGDIMQGFGVAIKCGVTKAQLDLTIGIHPTAAEELVTMRNAKYEVDASGKSML